MTTTTDVQQVPMVEPGRGSRLAAFGRVALVASPVVVLAVQAWEHRWIADDGFINLRIVQEVVGGHGPVFNAGQRVEAFTSPLWLAILAVADLLTPIRAEWLAVLLGILATIAGLALAIRGAAFLARDADREPGWLVPAGALVPLGLLPVWYFATSGLETGLVFAWQGISLWILARWAVHGRRVGWWEAAVLGLGWLVRPELGLMSATFLVALLAADWRVQRWPQRLALVAWAVAVPVAYEVFRMGYFASVVPNTAVAKEASLARWSQGWHYFTDSFGPYWLWIPLLALVVGAYVPLVQGLRRRGANRALVAIGAFVIGGVLDAAYIVRVGGDYIHARLLLPPVFAVVAPVAVVVLRPRTLAVLAVAPWALVSALWLRSDAVPYVPAHQAHRVTIDKLGWAPGGPARRWYRGPGVYYNARLIQVTPRRGLHVPTAASWGIGVASYAIGPRLHVLDLLGLADTLDAHFELVHRGFPGHEKPMPPAWTAALLTSPGSPLRVADFTPPMLVEPLVPWPTSDAQFARQVAWARAALRCPAIHDLLARASGPLSVTRFFSNVTHSFGDSRLRIPPDPERAYRKFCGSGFPPGTR